jgi:hypothetical protein
MAAFDRLSTKTATTKRAPAATAGKHVGAAVAYLTGLRCTPLDQVVPDSMREMVVNAPYVPLVTAVHGVYDIREGDVLVVDGVEYAIRVARRFDWKSSEYRVLIVEETRP